MDRPELPYEVDFDKRVPPPHKKWVSEMLMCLEGGFLKGMSADVGFLLFSCSLFIPLMPQGVIMSWTHSPAWLLFEPTQTKINT